MLLGQEFLLQSSCTVESPVHFPPLFSSTVFDRVFVRVPPPQLTEQRPLSQSVHSQSTKKDYYISYPIIFAKIK